MANTELQNSSRVVLSGASGLIGRSLSRSLVAQGLHVVQLVRQMEHSTPHQIFWNPYAVGIPVVLPSAMPSLEGLRVAIHLAGDNLASGRWTPEKKKRMWDSRVTTTRAIATLLSNLASPPDLLICASAIGYYGDRGDELLTEASSAGSDYLSEMCVAWEQAADIARQRGIRVVHLRLGVVLTCNGGALAKMLPLFRLGLGGRLGRGHQWISWIALEDVVEIIDHIRTHANIVGPVNVVSPHPVTNMELTQTLAQVLHRPALIPAPTFALRAVFGEMADATLLASVRVLPATLLQSGYAFQHSTLKSALAAALHPLPHALLG